MTVPVPPKRIPAIMRSLKACQKVICFNPKTSGIVMFQSHWSRAVKAKIKINIRKKKEGNLIISSIGSTPYNHANSYHVFRISFKLMFYKLKERRLPLL